LLEGNSLQVTAMYRDQLGKRISVGINQRRKRIRSGLGGSFLACRKRNGQKEKTDAWHPRTVFSLMDSIMGKYYEL
jgi:hypothetical protein